MEVYHPGSILMTIRKKLHEKPGKYEVNDLVKAVGGIEQRNYRHRSVEAWSMFIPWDGFARLTSAPAKAKAISRFLKTEGVPCN
jgi:hypothetical protein